MDIMQRRPGRKLSGLGRPGQPAISRAAQKSSQPLAHDAVTLRTSVRKCQDYVKLVDFIR